MSMSFGNRGSDNANRILMMDLYDVWDEDVNLSYQEKIVKMIQKAKKHWLVVDQKNQALCVINVAHDRIKKDDEELADALLASIKIKFNPQSISELMSKSEEELEEFTKFVSRASDILPKNWNELWQ